MKGWRRGRKERGKGLGREVGHREKQSGEMGGNNRDGHEERKE